MNENYSKPGNRRMVQILVTIVALVLSTTLLVNLTSGQEEPAAKGLGSVEDKTDFGDNNNPPATDVPMPVTPGKPKVTAIPSRPSITTGNKQLDRLGKKLIELDGKQSIEVKVKSLKIAKEKLKRNHELFDKYKDYKNADRYPELLRQINRLKARFNRVATKIGRIHSDILDGRYKAGGVKEGAAVRDLGLNRELFELYREGKRTELLVKMWDYEQSLVQLSVKTQEAVPLSFRYQETAPKPAKVSANRNGARGNVQKKVKVPIQNANAGPPTIDASFKPTLKVKVAVGEDHKIVISYQLKASTRPVIHNKIAPENIKRLTSEAVYMRAGAIGEEGGFTKVLGIDEVFQLRSTGKLEIDLSNSAPFRNVAIAGGRSAGRATGVWQLDSKPVVTLIASAEAKE